MLRKKPPTKWYTHIDLVDSYVGMYRVRVTTEDNKRELDRFDYQAQSIGGRLMTGGRLRQEIERLVAEKMK